jgi:hypothetical protein
MSACAGGVQPLGVALLSSLGADAVIRTATATVGSATIRFESAAVTRRVVRRRTGPGRRRRSARKTECLSPVWNESSASFLRLASQREEPVVAGGRTHGKRREADVRFDRRRRSERQLGEGQLTPSCDRAVSLRQRPLACRANSQYRPQPEIRGATFGAGKRPLQRIQRWAFPWSHVTMWPCAAPALVPHSIETMTRRRVPARLEERPGTAFGFRQKRRNLVRQSATSVSSQVNRAATLGC